MTAMTKTKMACPRNNRLSRPRSLRALLLTACVLFYALGCWERPAQAQVATGFMVQALLGASSGAISIGNVPTTGPSIDFGPLYPTVRLGVMLHSLAISADITYLSNARLSSGYIGENALIVGPDVAPYIFRSSDGRAGLYLLFGLNLGGIFESTPALVGGGTTIDSTFTGGFTVGVGGTYFMHPNFALGVEVGSRTQFARIEGDTFAGDVIYGALSGTFVAGR